MQILRQHTTYLQKCFACGRVGHNLYITSVNGQNYIVCSSAHALELEKEANKQNSLSDKEIELKGEDDTTTA